VPFRQERTGLVLSVMATKKLHTAEAPPLLNVVHTTDVLAPTLNALPEAGEHVLLTMGREPPAVAL
jgi:hypothetical protein